MRATKIEEQEIKFSEKLTNTSNVKYTDNGTEKIGNSTIRKIRPSFDSYYYKTEHKKDLIVIHSTAGTLRADMASLTNKDTHVSVSYVIARTGDIYELFDPKYWSYHLGTGAVGGNKINSARSIAIELSNYGPLTKNGDGLETIYSQIEYTNSTGELKKSKKDVYCDISEVDKYTVVDDGFRGYKYFATFTDAQYVALSDLIDYLCNTFVIPKTFIDGSARFETFKSATEGKSYTGICTHVNYRKSGKWDLGPDFEWDRIENAKIELDEVEISPDDNIEVEPEFQLEVKSEVKSEVDTHVEYEYTIPEPVKKSNIFGLLISIIGKLFRK